MHHAHVAEDGQGVAYVALSHGIRDDNQLGGIGVGCLLQYLRDAHAVVAEYAGDTCEHTHAVFHFKTQVIFALDILHLFNRQLFVSCAANAAGAVHEDVAGGVDNITGDRGSSRQLTGAAAHKHGVIQRIAVHKHRVKRIVDGSQRVR